MDGSISETIQQTPWNFWNGLGEAAIHTVCQRTNLMPLFLVWTQAV